MARFCSRNEAWFWITSTALCSRFFTLLGALLLAIARLTSAFDSLSPRFAFQEAQIRGFIRAFIDAWAHPAPALHAALPRVKACDFVRQFAYRLAAKFN
jgi:hypothetical protein